jgi:hypothetical protein
MKNRLFLFAAIAPAIASAQSADHINTYVAVTRTPIGALSPMLTNALIDRFPNGVSFGLRYANLSEGNFNENTNAAAATVILPAGMGANIRVTGGALFTDDAQPLITTPSTTFIASMGADWRFLGSSPSSRPTSPLVTMSIDGELGYGDRGAGSYLSGYIGLPIALVPHGSGMQFAPFVTPAFAFAQTSVDVGSETGAGFMVGGGLGVYNTSSSVIVNVGAQYFFMDGSRTAFGINVLFGGR